MDKEEYYKRIERINDKFKTDRVSADEEYQLVCQRNYLSTKYIKNLEQQCKKQKEVIDKATEWVRDWTHDTNDWFEEDSKPSELLDILNEVTE